MDLLSEQNGLTTFGIVLALATYTQAVSYRLLDKIDELDPNNDPEGKIPQIKQRMALITVGDFVLVILGWLAGWELFVAKQHSQPWWLSRGWGLAFFATVTLLSLMHGRAWKKAYEFLTRP